MDRDVFVNKLEQSGLKGIESDLHGVTYFYNDRSWGIYTTTNGTLTGEWASLIRLAEELQGIYDTHCPQHIKDRVTKWRNQQHEQIHRNGPIDGRPGN